MNMTAGQSDDSGKMKLDQLIDRARQLWESSPQPVKSFPWKRAAQNFVQLILDLIIAVVKYLCVPLLAVSSLSELSYCAHAKKLFFFPIPILIGMVIAEVFKLAALDVSPLLKVKLVCLNPVCIVETFQQVHSLQESHATLFNTSWLQHTLPRWPFCFAAYFYTSFRIAAYPDARVKNLRGFLHFSLLVFLTILQEKLEWKLKSLIYYWSLLSAFNCQTAEVPWHLIVMAIFFTLLKLPGPYYPFWGRIVIPHIANGGLLRTLWFAFLWYRRPQIALRTASSQHSESGSQSEVEPNKL